VGLCCPPKKKEEEIIIKKIVDALIMYIGKTVD
jgi:hypothetical protein